jgi:mRNA interferase RelE/StbE
MKEVVWTDTAAKYLARLDKPARERIKQAVYNYAETGYGDIKLLRGRLAEYRLRVGGYRVIFRYENGQLVIVVLKVGSRGDVYNA